MSHGATNFLQLLSRILVLTKTLAGECGVGRNACAEGQRDCPGVWGLRPQTWSDLTPAQTHPPWVPACPCLAPDSSFYPFGLDRFSLLPSPALHALLPPGPITDPGPRMREEVGSGLTLPASRLPLTDVFLYCCVPARSGAPLITVGYVDNTQFVRFDSNARDPEGWSRGAVGGAGGAGVLGSGDAISQGRSTDFELNLEQPARLLQQEQSR